MGGGQGQPFFVAARYVATRDAKPADEWRTRRALERAAEHGVDWWLWRLVLAPEIPDGLADIRQRWSFADVFDAHVVLDTLEAIKPEPRTAGRRR